MCRESPFLLCDVLCFLNVNTNPFSLEREGLPHLPSVFVTPQTCLLTVETGLAPPLEALLPPGPCVHATRRSWP